MKTPRLIYALILFTVIIGFNSCVTIPNGATAVKHFDKEKYLGKWYEIARLDFRHVKDLNNTTAEYSLNDNGTIKVFNRGFNKITEEWEEATGQAKFVGDENIGRLKVSFFRPFYSGYNVIAIDDEYKYALVAGRNLDYLWILSRETRITGEIRHKYLKIAEEIGFDTSELIWVNHDMSR